MMAAGADLRLADAQCVQEQFSPAVDPRRASACAFAITTAPAQGNFYAAFAKLLWRYPCGPLVAIQAHA